MRWVISRMSAAQIGRATEEDFSLWTSTLVKRNSSLMRDFLLKAGAKVKREMIVQALMVAVQHDREEQFDQLMAAPARAH